jgi:hypothetical protein
MSNVILLGLVSLFTDISTAVFAILSRKDRNAVPATGSSG